MKLKLFSLFICLSIFGCATTPIPITEAKPTPPERLLAFQQQLSEPTGIIHVIRDTGFIGSGCFYGFTINGVTSARLDTGESAMFYVKPGEILLKAGRDPQGSGLCGIDTNEWTQRETIIHTNEIKHFRLSMDANGKLDIQRAD